MTLSGIRNGLLLATIAWACAGCAETDRVESYTVRKPLPVESAQAAAQAAAPLGEPKDRTLAAIVPHKDQGWFFKLTGPKDPVAAQSQTFTTFVKSVHFTADDKPAWTLPTGWEQRPGSDIRYATLVIPAQPMPLEVSVTALPKPLGDDDNYALVNVNRWRNQLRLPPITLEQLGGEATRFDLDGATATMVDLLGTAAPDTMGRPPFFPGAGNGN
jgi:hypothetical protein